MLVSIREFSKKSVLLLLDQDPVAHVTFRYLTLDELEDPVKIGVAKLQILLLDPLQAPLEMLLIGALRVVDQFYKKGERKVLP